MSLLDDRGAAAVFVAVSARERELARNDYILKTHPHDLKAREDEYRKKYGDIDDVTVIAKRLGLAKEEVEASLKKLVAEWLIRPDRATLEAYSPRAKELGKDVLEVVSAGLSDLPRTYEVSGGDFLDVFSRVVGEHSPSSLCVEFDSKTCRITRMNYAPAEPSGISDEILREIKAKPYRVQSVFSFWLSFFSVELLSEYMKGSPRRHTLREMILHLLAELKELVVDVTLLDSRGKLSRSEADYTRCEYHVTDKAVENIVKALSDPGFRAVLRLADTLLDFTQAQLIRSMLLESVRHPLQEALSWDLGFSVRKETLTRVFVEDVVSTQERTERLKEEYKARDRNHYNFIPDGVKEKTWGFHEMLYAADGFQAAWSQIESTYSGNRQQKPRYRYVGGG